MVGSWVLRYATLLVVFRASLFVQASDSQAMTAFRMGVLYKNSEQTSCMVAVIDMKAGFVAANCIDLKNGAPDTSTSYQVHFTPLLGVDGFAVDLDPNDITIHPLYDPVTYANNIAVVQYNNGTTDTYHTLIETDTSVVNINVYTRWAFDQTSNNWTMPQVSNQNSDDSDCASGSALYAANTDYTRCTSATLLSIENDACSMPYGIMFQEDSANNIEVTHLYSHSVVHGNSMCDGETKILSYYSSLWLYLGWMVGVVGRPMLVFTGEEVEYWNNTRIGWQTDVGLASPAGTITVSGDLYPVQRAMVVGTNSESASSSGVSGSDTETSSSFSDDATEKDNTSDVNSDFDDVQDSRGLSKEAKIAIGVAVPVAVIIIAIFCAVGFKVWMSKDKSDDWDPQGEEAQLRTAALELFVGAPQATPPPYNRVHTHNGDVSQPEQTVEIKK